MKPYIDTLDNVLAILSGCQLILVFMASLFMRNQANSDDHVDSKGMGVILVVSYVLLILAFVAWVLQQKDDVSTSSSGMATKTLTLQSQDSDSDNDTDNDNDNDNNNDNDKSGSDDDLSDEVDGGDGDGGDEEDDDDEGACDDNQDEGGIELKVLYSVQDQDGGEGGERRSSGFSFENPMHRK
mmetsp:Transcript_6598/g.12713  ORF Transcript_6598/g.12713 Transcript_6598/m.12713 type:complete len:183 (+) Transcript_6598:409-957(+)